MDTTVLPKRPPVRYLHTDPVHVCRFEEREDKCSVWRKAGAVDPSELRYVS